MINLGNKSFGSIGQIVSVALAVALVLKDWRDGLEFVVSENFKGVLADTSGVLEAVFVNEYGNIDRLPLSTDMLFVKSIGEVREDERQARFARDEAYRKAQNKERCEAKAKEIRLLLEKGDELERQLIELEDKISSIILEHNEEHRSNGAFSGIAAFV